MGGRERGREAGLCVCRSLNPPMSRAFNKSLEMGDKPRKQYETRGGRAFAWYGELELNGTNFLCNVGCETGEKPVRILCLSTPLSVIHSNSSRLTGKAA